MNCHISKRTVKQDSFTVYSRNDVIQRTIDKEPYLLSSNRTKLFDRFLLYLPDELLRNKKLRNELRNISSYLLSKHSHSDILLRFGFFGDNNEYDYLRFHILNKLVKYGANQKALQSIYDTEIPVSDSFRQSIANNDYRIESFIKDYINYAKNKNLIDLTNAKQINHIASASAMAIYTSIVNNPSRYSYSLIDTVEKDMQLEKHFKNPLLWSTIMFNEYAYTKTIALENYLRTKTYDDITNQLWRAGADNVKESMDITALTFQKMYDWAVDKVLSGDLTVGVIGEIGSTVITELILQGVGRTVLALACLLPAGWGASALFTAGEFLLSSFIANFAFQVFVEWELDGYIQELLRPVVDMLPYNQYKKEMRDIYIKEDYRDLYLSLLKEKGLLEYVYGKDFKAPDLQDVIERIKNRPYYTEDTLAKMMWHLNLSYLKLTAKLYLTKKKYEELKKQYELEKQKRIQLRDYIKDLPILPADSSLNDITDRVEDIIKHIDDPNLKFYKDAIRTIYNNDGSVISKYYNEYITPTFEIVCGECTKEDKENGAIGCKSMEEDKEDYKKYLKCYEVYRTELNHYSYCKNEDNYKFSYKIFIQDLINCCCNRYWSDYFQSLVYERFNLSKFYYLLSNELYKKYEYNENYRYDNLSYPILKALMYPNHLLRRINIGKKFLTLHFDSGHKVYVYYSDKKHYCYFNSYEDLSLSKRYSYDTYGLHLYHKHSDTEDNYNCKIATDFSKSSFYASSSSSPSGNSKSAYFYFSVFDNKLYLYLYRHFRLGQVNTTTLTDYKRTGKEREISQYVSFYYNFDTEQIEYPSIDSYIQNTLYKDWDMPRVKRNIPLDIYIAGKKQLIVPFNLSTYKQKQSVINPLQPDNPKTVKVEDITKAVSLDDFVDAVKFEFGSKGLKRAFIKELLIEFATLTYGYGYELTGLNDMLYYLAGLTYLPLNISYWLAKSTYETLFYLKQNDYQIEVYDF
ncbi:MAG: hypothetical protein ACP5JX_04135 [Sulfurihydrogenibium sp.]